jgi:fatty acid desaturase
MNSRSLDHQRFQMLCVPSGHRALADFLSVWGLIAAVIAVGVVLDRWYVYLAAIIVIGARQNALATLAHEGWHGLLFSSRRATHNLAAWFYAYPLGILYYHDRDRHLRHHREVGHDYDPDWINYTSEHRETPGLVLWYLASLLLGRLLFSTVASFITRGRPRIALAPAKDSERQVRPGISGELFRVLVCQSLLFGAMLLATHRWWVYPVFWMLPLATFAGFFANFRALVEHVTVSDDVEPETRLRDIRSGPIEGFFIAPSHFNYHALHHAHPAIPHYNLPRGKKEYVAQLGSYPFTVCDGYGKTLVSHLKELGLRA